MSGTPVASALVLGVLLGGSAPGTVHAEQPPLAPLIGAFVGRAEQVDEAGNREQRDIDVVIAPYEREGLRITWTNVTLVNGRRDVPGVKRRSDEILLVPAPDRSFYLAGVGYDPFHARPEPDPMRGDPLRWGSVAGGSIDVYSFVILDDGRYELQIFERRPTEDGMTLEFDRILDGEVVRRLTGHAVRAE
ncbi:hypothetical protein [Benzoatithermus flavus]|uniref:Uncharacterized protein n=1 Tax=Benzoatithermus flavus TaxID=3108223 RepID=A0ABU8XU19_9PROT